MKLYHIVFIGIIVTGFILALTAYDAGARGGLLYDLSKYNNNINVSKFTADDVRSDIDSDISSLKNNSDAGGVTDSDTEQNILLKLWTGTKDMASSFTTVYKLLRIGQDELNIPAIFFWIITSILGVFILAKLAGRFFLDR